MKFKKAKFGGDLGNITLDSQQNLLDETDRLIREGASRPPVSPVGERRNDNRPKPPRNPEPVQKSHEKPVQKVQKGFTSVDATISTDNKSLTFNPFRGLSGILDNASKAEEDDVRTDLVVNPPKVEEPEEEEVEYEEDVESIPMKMMSPGMAKTMDGLESIESQAVSPMETFESSFSPLTIDGDLSRIFIDDMTSMEIKSHCINFHCLQEAKVDYNSVAYQEYMKLGFTAIMFIAGPTLILKEGNQLFKDFLSRVDSFNPKKVRFIDSLRLYAIVKIEDSVSKNLGRACEDLLLYCIAEDTVETYVDMMNIFEENNIALDFLCALFTMATSRYSTPWHDLSYVDGYIDTVESAESDVSYVLDIIENDERTTAGSMTYNDFILSNGIGNLDYVWDQMVEARKVLEKLLNPYNGDSCYEVASDFLVENKEPVANNIALEYDPGEKEAIIKASTSITTSTTVEKEEVVVEKVDNPEDIEVDVPPAVKESPKPQPRPNPTQNSSGPLVVPKLL